MAGKLEEFFQYIETGRNQDALNYRESAQEEYFKAKNRLGPQERKKCENIDQIFSFVEKGLYKEAKCLLEKAKLEYNDYISPAIQSIHQEKCFKSTPEIAGKTEAVNPKTNTHSVMAYSNSNDMVDQLPAIQRSEFSDQSLQTKTSDEDLYRASKEASEKLRKDNPNIADLSDTNRPTKTVERFSELYDNEWTEAYLDLTQKQKLNERNAVDMLYKVVLAAYDFCLKEAKLQIHLIQRAAMSIVMHGQVKQSVTMTKELDTYPLVQFRKGIAEHAVTRLQNIFVGTQKKQCINIKNSSFVQTFAKNCVEITWWMCVQNPPVHMYKGSSGPVTHSLYKPYTQSGKTVDFYIWPPLLLYENGPMLSKDIVQAK